MSLLPSEEIIKYSFNLPPEAFDSMKIDMRLFGSRTRRALKTDLRSRLDKKRKNHQADEVLQYLGLENYKESARRSKDSGSTDGNDFEKAIMKIEYLVKASLYSTDEKQSKALMENASESLEAIGLRVIH